MASLGEVLPHLTLDELENRYRTCKDATVKTWWQIVWLRAKGKPTQEVVEVVSSRPDWVRRVVRRYNKEGVEGMRDHRAENGHKPRLSQEQQAQLLQALSRRAPDGGLWNGRKVAKWIEATFGWRPRRKCGWQYLRRVGWTIQKPRPRHSHADPVAQEEFKKNFPTR